MLSHWQDAFLRQLRRTGSITTAAELIGKHRSTVYHHIRRDRAFARQVRGAQKLHVERNLHRILATSPSGA